MTNTTIISRTLDNGLDEHKEIYELEEKDVFKYRLIGKSMGINMDDCVTLGIIYSGDFWHRVYAYRIMQNEEQEKLFLDEMRKTRPDLKSYMTVNFYERFSEQQFMNIPQRLVIPDRPELINFPFNIMFTTLCIKDNNEQRYESSIYNPVIASFSEVGEDQKMRYFNNLNSNFWVEIIYNTHKQSYIGTKYCGNKMLGMAEGKEWKMFFVHLTGLGVASGLVIDSKN